MINIPELGETKLDHIAIAVQDLEKSVEMYTLLGLNFSSEREVVESQHVKTAFAPVDKYGHIELLESTSDSGPIAKYIEKKGPGIHHICLSVDNIEAKQKELEDKGMKFIHEKPFAGANNCLVNFIHPKSMQGVLIELSQKLRS